jgi:membrane-bound serine protease (ClpP class)
MSWFPVFLIGLGVLLLFIEIVLLPGFGVAGISGIVSMVIGVGLVWSEFGLTTGLIYASAAVALTIPFAIFGLWLAPRTRFVQSLILDATESRVDGFQAPPQDLVKLVGKSGISITPLRPAGMASIEGRRIDVVSQGEFTDAKIEVEVILVEGNRVVVRSL